MIEHARAHFPYHLGLVTFSAIYALLRFLVWRIELAFRSPRSLQAEILSLRQQIATLERQVGRVRWQPADRLLLALLRPHLPRSAWQSLLVKPETVLGWHRDLVRRKWAAFLRRPRRGRPPLPDDVRDLVLLLARENPRWGYIRIVGEMRKLDHRLSATSVRSVLRQNRVPPAPCRGSLTWKRFLAAQATSIIATDFFTVETVFLKRLHVLFFLHLASRRILFATCTDKPDSAWVSQQARNLSWRLADEGLQITHLIRDRDGKFPPAFDDVFKSEGMDIIQTPFRAPRANAFAERWVGSARRETLDWLLVANQRHLQTILNEYVDYHNHARPHRGLGLATPVPRTGSGSTQGPIRRRSRLGGLINEYSIAPDSG